MKAKKQKYKGTYQVLHTMGLSPGMPHFFVQWSPRKRRPHKFSDIGQADTIEDVKKIMHDHEKKNR